MINHAEFLLKHCLNYCVEFDKNGRRKTEQNAKKRLNFTLPEINSRNLSKFTELKNKTELSKFA